MWLGYLLCVLVIGWVGTLTTLAIGAYMLGSSMPTNPED
jgi:hypothetical protein